ncbi:DNA mismatch repair protein MutL [Fulvitalea axinellae]|uniref:DNA mismatch repair protein MutL n=1 Tax=Fulvitalea axinellae TaxID=1182444 RepID=A0AAU9CS02_9BACT|nr:DNA mismatch repair protein MutL [Fulvitalea axinellae]
MSDIIRLLPDSIANQIAAGEVVQRPASVVKEMMENSIDAGSANIQVIVKDAGKTLIQVIDDGAGMSETDARMSFERHATSKIRKAEDLFSLRTMGFRGEAVASIAAVAQVELKTRREEDECGTLIRMDGSKMESQEPVSCSKGTNFTIRNLFFNIPARRNFLKSNGVEMRHIIDEFQRVALANPEVGFSLVHNGTETYKLPAAKLSKRIVSLFGKNYKSQLIPCGEKIPNLNVHGYIGKPEFAKKSRGEQFFFVNNRFVKSSYLNHAVTQAYEGLLHKDAFPFYVIFIEIDPKQIDVNVHPTKTEIKFDDERTVFSIIKATVRQALGTNGVTPSLDFESNINFNSFSSADIRKTIESESIGSGAGPEEISSVKNPAPKTTSYERFSNAPKSGGGSWEKLFESSDTSDLLSENSEKPESHSAPIESEPEPSYSAPIIPEKKDEPKAEAEAETSSMTFSSAANEIRIFPETESRNGSDRSEEPFQLHGTYVVTQVKSGIMLIGQQEAHERIMYERFSTQLVMNNGTCQQLLFPQTLSLNPADVALVSELSEEIRALGFAFDLLENGALTISGIPNDCSGTDAGDLFGGLIEQIRKNETELSLNRQDNIAKAMAKRSAIKTGQALKSAEMRALIDHLFACSNPNYSPDGKPTYYILSMEQIAGFFGKN